MYIQNFIHDIVSVETFFSMQMINFTTHWSLNQWDTWFSWTILKDTHSEHKYKVFQHSPDLELHLKWTCESKRWYVLYFYGINAQYACHIHVDGRERQ